jgi:hypothetical protein
MSALKLHGCEENLPGQTRVRLSARGLRVFGRAPRERLGWARVARVPELVNVIWDGNRRESLLHHSLVEPANT